MAESPNAAAVRRFVDAFNSGDVYAVMGEADPDVVLDEWPEAPGSRSYRGRGEVREAIAAWFETWEWMKVEIEDLDDLGDRIFFSLHQRAKGKGSGVEVEIRSWNVYTFRDEVLIHVQLFLDRDSALEAAGLTHTYEEEKR